MKNMKKKIIISSVATIVICLSLILGSTYALFTDTANINIAATSAKVDIEAHIDQNSLKVYSLDVLQTATNAEGKNLFENGGTAAFDTEGNLVLDLVAPGDKVEFDIALDNESNIAIKYNVRMIVEYDATGLTQEKKDATEAFMAALVAKATINGTTYDITGTACETGFILVNQNADFDAIPVTVELPWQTGNEAQDSATVTVKFVIEVIQGNGEDLYLNGETETGTETEIETETETETN